MLFSATRFEQVIDILTRKRSLIDNIQRDMLAQTSARSMHAAIEAAELTHLRCVCCMTGLSVSMTMKHSEIYGDGFQRRRCTLRFLPALQYNTSVTKISNLIMLMLYYTNFLFEFNLTH